MRRLLEAGELGYVVAHIATFNFLLMPDFVDDNLGYEAVEGFIKCRLKVGEVFLRIKPGVEITDMGMIRVKDEEGAVLESAPNGNKPSYSINYEGNSWKNVIEGTLVTKYLLAEIWYGKVFLILV